MMITLRSSLATSVTMFSLRDSSMDKDRAFLFLGLFSIILLKTERKTFHSYISPTGSVLPSVLDDAVFHVIFHHRLFVYLSDSFASVCYRHFSVELHRGWQPYSRSVPLALPRKRVKLTTERYGCRLGPTPEEYYAFITAKFLSKRLNTTLQFILFNLCLDRSLPTVYCISDLKQKTYRCRCWSVT